MLFGPGEKAVAIPNKIKEINCANIKLCLVRFQFFETDESIQLFHLSLLLPKSKPQKQSQQYFFFGKLQTPITCFPTKFSEL